MKRVFRKEKWLAAAQAQMEQGILRQEEIDNAAKQWADKFDGKTAEEIGEEAEILSDEWFEEVSK